MSISSACVSVHYPDAQDARGVFGEIQRCGMSCPMDAGS